MKDGSVIRRATESEAQLISAIAMRAKAHWGYSADFMAACREELMVTPEHLNDLERDYFVYQLDREIVGFFSLVPISNAEIELDALFVEPGSMGFGYGRELFEYAKELASGRGAKTLRIQSDPNAAAFYLAVGATHIGDTESGSIAGRLLPEYKIELPASLEAS